MPTTGETNAKPSAPPSLAERDLEFKKRQQESREKAEKAAKEQAQLEDRQENCRRAKQNVELLESGQRVLVPNEKGENEALMGEKRQQELDRARSAVTANCK